MIPGHNLKIKLNPQMEKPLRGYKFAGGTYQYAWVVCPKDQTLVIWDCLDDDAVVATVTLTASKNFTWGFYRSVDKSVYVMGDKWVDRVDIDPANVGGTFGTVVEAMETDLTLVATHNYVPYPFDAIFAGRAGAPLIDMDYIPVSHLSNVAGLNNQQYHSRDGKFNGFPPRLGHSVITDARYYPDNNMLCINGQFYDIVAQRKEFRTSGKFKLKGNDLLAWNHYMGNQLAIDHVNTYLFKNFVICNTGSSSYIMGRNSSSYLYDTLTSGIGSGGKYLFEYCPNARRVFVSGKITTTIGVFELGNGTLTDLGDISRAAYAATNENGTDDMAYNPVNGLLYVTGKRHQNTPDTDINKVHVYDPTQDIGDMYLRSITVGEMGGSQRSGNYALNSMGFNGNRYWESDHSI